MQWGCMLCKISWEITIITSTVNAEEYIGIKDTFIMQSIQNRFGSEVIFQDDDMSLDKANSRGFLAGKAN